MTTTVAEHPIFTAARAERERTGRDPYISPADTAKLIRAELARHWPAVRFTVRTSVYSGGASVRIGFDGVEHDERGRILLTWVDYDGVQVPGAPVVNEAEMDYTDRMRWGPIPRAGMPSTRDVEAVLGAYSGRRFDGMMDLAYGVSSWLNPDGSATFGASPGTGASHGSDPGYIHSRTAPDSLLVHFGANYVFVESRN